MCPICTVTVVAGLGLSRLLGIDDAVVSLWIGAFIFSFSHITIDWIEKKWPKLKFKRFTLPFTVFIYLLILVPLKISGSIGIAGNTLWGIDKIILGIVVGSALFFLGVWADKKVRKVRGHQFFKFQKVIFPVITIIIASAVFLFLTK